MGDTPKVTVVICTYNRAGLLPRAVESLLTQTYANYEVIIVDDGSADNTQDVIATFTDPRIRSFRHESNKGLSTGRNTALTVARGEYIAFLDDDDEYLPNNLETRVHAMDSAPREVGLVYGWRDDVDDSTGEAIDHPRETLEGDLFEYLLKLGYVGGSLDIMVRKSVALEVGGFDETLRTGEDLVFMVQAARRNHIAVVPQVLAMRYQRHGHAQITELTPEGNLRRVQFLRRYLDIYSDDLGKRPKAKASVLARSALAELRCHNWRESLSAAGTSLRLDPLGTIILGVRYCVRRLQARRAQSAGTSRAGSGV